jgi:hypothetical protein
MRLRFLLLTFGLLLPISIVVAAFFPDVPSSHRFSKDIYSLHLAGVINGNDDGTFAPERTLNRAELTHLALRAAKIEIRSVLTGCRKDLPASAWYSAGMCTAIDEHIIQGYPDGSTKPAQEVINVEAMKIINGSLGIPIPYLTHKEQVGIDFKYVNVKSWYAPHLLLGTKLNYMPTELLKDNEFRPDAPVTRGVAAAMLNRAMNADLSILENLTFDEEEEEEGDDEEDEEDTGDDEEDEEDTGDDEGDEDDDEEEEGDDEEVTPTGATLVDFPLHRTGKTGERGAAAYAFTLDEPGTVLLEAMNLTSASTGIDCFLYLLGESGFSYEFFLGHKEGGSCYIRASLRAGSYQVEVRSRSEGADYSLDVTPAEGDGNDGFIEATALTLGNPRSGILLANDYEDWFRVRNGRKEPHRVHISSSSNLNCTLFPADDVDLSSFAMPKCNETSEFDTGTWYISIQREEGTDAAERKTYSIEWR